MAEPPSSDAKIERSTEMSAGEMTDPIIADLDKAVAAAVKTASGRTVPVRPSHRIPFHWPPHAVSMDFHVLASDWSGSDEFELDGEIFEVSIAKTPFGIFGRCVKYWNEAKANSLEEVIEGLKKGLKPLLDRQRAIGHALGMPGRCTDEVRKSLPVSAGSAALLQGQRRGG